MIALRAALVVLVIASLTGSAMTARYDGAWLIGLLAAGVLGATFGVFSRSFWTAPSPRDDGELFPALRPEPRWERLLAFVASPLLVALAVALLIRAAVIS